MLWKTFDRLTGKKSFALYETQSFVAVFSKAPLLDPPVGQINPVNMMARNYFLTYFSV